VILGTMEVGRRVTQPIAAQMLSKFSASGNCEIDTATLYADTETESILGNIAENWKDKAKMATKINPWGPNPGKPVTRSHGLNYTKESVRAQVNHSLARLQVESVDILYLHAPDHVTPLPETLEALAELKSEGKFAELGLSNYSSWLTCEVVNVASRLGFPVPSVYQGMYSALTRQVELELIPCLRYHGMRFYAYSPLGGGLLTGKHSADDVADNKIKSGRFNGLSWDNVYRDRYFKREYFDGLDRINLRLKEVYPNNTPSLAEVSFSWLFHHSALGAQDGVVIGASSIRQLERNLALCSASSPLADEIVAEFERLWRETSHLCPIYLR